MIQYVLVAGVAAVVTGVLTWPIIRLSKRFHLAPEVRDRDVHTAPTPRLGGVAILAGVLAAFAVAVPTGAFTLAFDEHGGVAAVIGAAVMIVAVGVLDDLFDLDWTLKLAAQLGAALLLAWQGVQLLSLPIGGRVIGAPWIGVLVTVLAVVITMNAVNFIDGLDGLVAGVAIIANLAFLTYSHLLAERTERAGETSLAALISSALVGACAGFLIWNWRPAKIFMGDSGSMLVGLLMATSTIAVTGQVDAASLGPNDLVPALIPVLLPVAILFLPLLDLALAVWRRLRAGRSPFAADRQHLHHRLMDLGHPHLRAVLVFYAWTVLLCGTMLSVFVFADPDWAWLILIFGGLACSVFTVWPVLVRRINRYLNRGTASVSQLEEVAALGRAAAAASATETTTSKESRDEH